MKLHLRRNLIRVIQRIPKIRVQNEVTHMKKHNSSNSKNSKNSSSDSYPENIRTRIKRINEFTE